MLRAHPKNLIFNLITSVKTVSPNRSHLRQQESGLQHIYIYTIQPITLGQLGYAIPACRSSESEQCDAWAYLETVSPTYACPGVSQRLSQASYAINLQHLDKESQQLCWQPLPSWASAVPHSTWCLKSSTTLIPSLPQQASPACWLPWLTALILFKIFSTWVFFNTQNTELKGVFYFF